MLHATALLVCLAIGNSGQSEMLVFTSDRCPACRQAAPTVARLTGEGAPIRMIDTDFDGDLVRRFKVDAIPCFVMLVDGREVDRAVGPVGYARMVEMLSNGQTSPQVMQAVGHQGSGPGDVTCEGGQCQLRDHQTPKTFGGEASPASLQATRAAAPPVDYAPQIAQGRGAGASPQSAEASALAASVRIRVDDAEGTGFGSGVIIDVKSDGQGGQEALVMTCGHLFRDFNPATDSIEVDFPHHGDNRPVKGMLIDHTCDKADVGLIAIRPIRAVQAVRVATTAVRPGVGEPVFTIGCDKGDPPTIRRSRINAIDKYLGPPNIVVAGQPIQGRSGGGLFSANGELIGVCNAADPQDDEGLYAALPLLHWQLARVGQERIFRGDIANAANSIAAHNQAPAPAIARNESVASAPISPGSATFAGSRRSQPVPELTPASLVTAPRGEEAPEVVIVVRPRNGQPAQTVVIEQPSAQLLDEVQRAASAANAPRRSAPAASDVRTASLPTTSYRRPVEAVTSEASNVTPTDGQSLSGLALTVTLGQGA